MNNNDFSLYIQASNVHQGGGRNLLESLYNALPSTLSVNLLIDIRMKLPWIKSSITQIKYFKSNLFSRFSAELYLLNNVTVSDIVLCFGNLPPLFKLKGRVIVFLQNRYLIDDINLNDFPYRVRIRILMERLWLSWRLRNVDEFIVQTPTMKRILDQKTCSLVPISVRPFVKYPDKFYSTPISSAILNNKIYDFVYIASGEPHKNHLTLLKAWCELAKNNIFPSLCLTIDENIFSKLCKELDNFRMQFGINVINLGVIPQSNVYDIYKLSKAAIYPSTLESFGLPLIEARQAGLPVLASELDYVRDILDPEQTFDPCSPVSISRAVLRFIENKNYKLELIDPKKFIDFLIKV